MPLEGRVNMVGELNYLCSKEGVLLSYLLSSRICALKLSGAEQVTSFLDQSSNTLNID